MTDPGMETLAALIHRPRIALDEDGFPHPAYIDDVAAALRQYGIDAGDTHREEPWDLFVELPCVGDFIDYKRLLLCWRADELDPTAGDGWYLLPHEDPDKQGGPVVDLLVPHHATPAEVAKAVSIVLL